MNFFVGQKVVCVDDQNTDVTGWQVLCVGAIYTIRWIGVWRHPFLLNDAVCVRLEEVHRGPDPWAPHDKRCGDMPFYACRFRPVKTTDISIFTKMLAPTPKEKEPV